MENIGEIFNRLEFERIRIIKVSIFCIFSILIILFVALLMIKISTILDNEIDNETMDVYDSPGEEFECNNLTFFETAQCLNDYVNEIFIYNITDDEIELTLEELKANGGDCKNWADFYYNNMVYYGYSSERIRVFVNEENNETDVYHAFIISYSEDGYCSLDMREISCFIYNS